MTGESRGTRRSTLDVHPAWLPDAAWAHLGARTVAVVGDGGCVETVRAELAAATTQHGGRLVRTVTGADVAFVLDAAAGTGTEGFAVTRDGDRTVVTASADVGLLHGMFHPFRHDAAVGSGGAVSGPDDTAANTAVLGRFGPDQAIRMLDHWDNMTVHPVMGQVERGYAGGSIFWSEGRLREDLSRVADYARLLAAAGVNAVAVNNVNVHAVEARLITDGLDQVARLAEIFRPWGIRVFCSVSFAAPMTVGGLDTADPLDPAVQQWWAAVAERIYAAIGDFGGFVVKADSEGQPGPFGYGRTHADGANTLARALAPHGGTVFWRAFVYNHRQDWRDRSTDRARAAYDHFTPLDGQFDDNVVVQVKFGPIDFQPREPVSPVLAAMPATRIAVELQVTQEYTGQQRHVCYLGPQWHEVLDFRPWGDERSVADVVGGRTGQPTGGGVVAVSNVGDSAFWTGHPLAQANLYAFGRLAWDPTLDPAAILDEWIGLTFGDDDVVRDGLHRMMDDSWRTYERYSAPLGVGFMVDPGSHYGPGVDGYEYTPWGTYHFADRDGVGVDRTRATGTGYTGQYHAPWRDIYESPLTCPDELLLFFHHVPYDHVLASSSTVIQHIYDTHFAGVAEVEQMAQVWQSLAGRVPAPVFDTVTELLAEQLRCAREWRDQVNTYFFRKSGVPDARGRTIY